MNSAGPTPRGVAFGAVMLLRALQNRARSFGSAWVHVCARTAGSAYFERCTRLLDDLEKTECALTRETSELHGVLRVNAPMAFSLLHLSPLLPPFLERWRQLKLDVGFTDRFVDVVEEGVDVVVRIAASLPDSATLLVQRLARTRHYLVASPAYLRGRGAPTSIAALGSHACLSYSLSRTPDVWELTDNGRSCVARCSIASPTVLSRSARSAVFRRRGTQTRWVGAIVVVAPRADR